MAQEARTTLKTYFQTGDKPTQAQFINLIDSAYNPTDDGAVATSSDLTSHTSDTNNPHSTTADQVLPDQTSNSGKVLGTNGTNASWVAAASGSGDVTGPASSTLNHIPQFSDTTGKVLKDGLAVTTSLGSPGVDTNLPTEKAVRAAISAAGGGDFSGPASSTAAHFVAFADATGKLGEDTGYSPSSFLAAGTTTAGVPDSTDNRYVTDAQRTVITNTSGINTGDQDLSTLVPKTTTVNSKALSANVTLTTADIADSTNKRYVTDANLTVIGNTSGTNTGDQTVPSNTTSTAGQYFTAYNSTTGAFTKVQPDHTSLQNIGTNTHAQIDTHIAATTTAHGGILPSSAFSGVAKITVGTTQPTSPSAGDLWVDTN